MSKETKAVQKKCFNKCPRCEAGIKDIEYVEWGAYECSGETIIQKAVCKQCGQEFTENYVYSYSEIEFEVETK
jgi:hypothetical protein